MLNTTSTLKANRAFTIVELLIVIVVIAILAAISIVAYNGIQSRSRQASAQSTQASVAKKAESWNAIQGSYPTYCQFVTNTTNATGSGTGVGTAGCTAGAAVGPPEAKLDDPNFLTAVAPTSANGVNTVQYVICGANTGARMNYFYYTNNVVTATAASGSTPASPTIGTGC